MEEGRSLWEVEGPGCWVGLGCLSQDGEGEGRWRMVRECWGGVYSDQGLGLWGIMVDSPMGPVSQVVGWEESECWVEREGVGTRRVVEGKGMVLGRSSKIERHRRPGR